MPTQRFEIFEFPNQFAFAQASSVKRPFEPLGWVRSKVNFQSLDVTRDEAILCRNYYNKAVKQLVDTAKQKGADAVVDIKSVVFLEDGRRELYSTPECSDDGFEGQILVQGVAIKWKKEPEPKASPQASTQMKLDL